MEAIVCGGRGRSGAIALMSRGVQLSSLASFDLPPPRPSSRFGIPPLLPAAMAGEEEEEEERRGRGGGGGEGAAGEQRRRGIS